MIDKTYKNWLIGLKVKIRSAQLKAAVAVNSELITLYWDLGKMITEKQTAWGSKFIEQLSRDLRAEFPDMEGFSFRNLKYCRQFYQFYENSLGQQAVAQSKASSELIPAVVGEIWQQAVAKIPWGHNILIFSKWKDINEAHFYIEQNYFLKSLKAVCPRLKKLKTS
jgi:predicted nuclease of restriction endonuclease-like (RecB) superfamily